MRFGDAGRLLHCQLLKLVRIMVVSFAFAGPPQTPVNGCHVGPLRRMVGVCEFATKPFDMCTAASPFHVTS